MHCLRLSVVINREKVFHKLTISRASKLHMWHLVFNQGYAAGIMFMTLISQQNQ